MGYIWILFALFAAVALAPMVVYVLPFSVDKKLNPAVMFLSALACLTLPHTIVIALALTVPMGLVFNWTGVRLQGHEPVRIRVPVLDVRKGVLKLGSLIDRRKVPVTEVLTREFPLPESARYVPDL